MSRWHRGFPLSASVQEKLRGTYSDLKLVLLPNVPEHPGPWIIDAIDFHVPESSDGGTGTGGAGGMGGSSAGGSSGASSGGSGTGGSSGTSGSGGTSSGGSGGTGEPPMIGPCTFGPQPPASPTTPVNFTYKLPAGVAPESVALVTTGGQLLVNDGVRVVSLSGGFSSVSSVESTNYLRLGAFAETQDIFHEPDLPVLGNDVIIDSASHVHGNVTTAGTVFDGPNSTVDGEVREQTSLQPLQTLGWEMVFSSTHRGSCSIEPDQTQELACNSAYGDIAVKARSHLKLRSCGVSGSSFFFQSLSLEPESVLEVDNSQGPVRIYIRDGFLFRGATVESAPSIGNILFAYAGTNTVPIESPWRGVLIAPQASVTMITTEIGHL